LKTNAETLKTEKLKSDFSISAFPHFSISVFLFLLSAFQLFPQCCPPAIASQPQSQIIGQGNSVTFNVTIAPSSTFPTYDWRFNGVTVFHTAGGTNSITRLRSPVQPCRKLQCGDQQCGGFGDQWGCDIDGRRATSQ
jgi:hypothetical protein